MSIEEQLDTIQHEIRTTNIFLGDLMKIAKSYALSVDAPIEIPTPVDETPSPAAGGVFDNPPTPASDDSRFANVDFSTLDNMGCPYDPSIMTETRKINNTGSMKGCFAKKRDKNYDEGQYIIDRRVLINAAKTQPTTPPAAQPTTLPAPPVIGAPSIPPAAPLEPQPPVALPIITDVTTIDEDSFNALSGAFVLKYPINNEGAKILAEKLTACGQPGKTPSDMAGPTFQEIRTWIANEIIKHDGQS